MILLDENINEDQRQMLVTWKVRVHQIGYDVGRPGIQDREILTLLHELKLPTLFTLDRDFCQPRLCHGAYSLVYLFVRQRDTATYVRRVVKHPALNTRSKRMGTVVRVSDTGLHVWRRNAEEQELSWP